MKNNCIMNLIWKIVLAGHQNSVFLIQWRNNLYLAVQLVTKFFSLPWKAATICLSSCQWNITEICVIPVSLAWEEMFDSELVLFDFQNCDIGVT